LCDGYHCITEQTLHITARWFNNAVLPVGSPIYIVMAAGFIMSPKI